MNVLLIVKVKILIDIKRLYKSPPPNYVRLLSLGCVSTTLFIVNFVGHIVYEKINTKNIADNIMGTLFCNPQYITLEAYIVGWNISFGWKIMCIWETADKVRSNSCPSYLEGFNFEIRLLNSCKKIPSYRK